MYLAQLTSALLIGGLLGVQAAANQQLNRAVGTPFGAATLQLLVAAAALALPAVVTGSIAFVGQVGEVAPWWLLLGGVASPIYITAGILLFPRLGALAAVGLFVAGQVFASLALDLLGLLWVPRRPLDLRILLGTTAVLAGITMIVTASQRVPAGAGIRSPGPVIGGVPAPAGAGQPASTRGGWIALGVAAGAVLPVQGAINGRLRLELGSPLAAATVSFAVATLTIAGLLVVLLVLHRTSPPRIRPLRAMPWWGWSGGLCAAAYVSGTFLLIPAIGAAVTVAFTVAGQQLVSALIDRNGWFRLPRRPLTSPRAAGLTLLVAGAVLVQLA